MDLAAILVAKTNKNAIQSPISLEAQMLSISTLPERQPVLDDLSTVDLTSVVKFWPDGCLSRIITVDGVIGAYLHIYDRLYFVPVDTIDQLLEEFIHLNILISGVNYSYKECAA
jgi:hypothetical protein